MIWQNTHETPLLHGILDIIKIDVNDRKNKNNHSVRPVQQSNRKFVDTEAKSLPSNTHIIKLFDLFMLICTSQDVKGVNDVVTVFSINICLK
jgi:hypothetical protein